MTAFYVERCRALIAAAMVFASPAMANADSICRPGYAREQRLAPDRYYPVAQEAYRLAGVAWADRHQHTLDHIVPLCLGGGWEQGNLQVQSIEDAKRKDKLERFACIEVCARRVPLAKAVAWFHNWEAGCKETHACD